MKALLKSLLPLIVMSWNGASLADIPERMRTAIEPLITSNIPTAQIGIVVADAKSGEILYDRNSFQAFIPASNAKLFTGAAALFGLGPDYRYATSIATNKSGNLYWQFTGDPSLTHEHIAEMIGNLRRAGVHRITGDIVIDSSRFSGPVYARGWCQDDLNWYCFSPITAIIIDQNTIGVNLTPSDKLKGKASTNISDPNLRNMVKLSSDIQTVTEKQAERYCSLNLEVDQQNTITMSGCWPIENKSKFLKIAVKNPERIAESYIRLYLQQHDIAWNGKITHGKKPADATTLVTHESQPIKTLIYTLMKDSNNIYAESFCKTLGYKQGGTGSFQIGANAIADILQQKANIDYTQLKLVDGSGGSRYNLVTPRQLMRILFVLYHTPTLGTLYRDALPVSGKNGTLKSRMTSFDLGGNIQAKTGTLSGVSTLSGYMTTSSGRDIVFSIMMDHLVVDAKEARSLQSKITAAFYML
jgi:D-alanyl-D-alanine carboxypeptidase/D-alanyl-D-alanine-endopeptidase (penicillin-binding protein 4)